MTTGRHHRAKRSIACSVLALSCAGTPVFMKPAPPPCMRAARPQLHHICEITVAGEPGQPPHREWKPQCKEIGAWLVDYADWLDATYPGACHPKPKPPWWKFWA